MRIHKNHVDGDRIILLAFKKHGVGMSTEWEKYSTAEETRERAREFGKDPGAYGVVAFVTGEVRAIPGHSVVHSPTRNRAHTDVIGPQSEESRVLLSRICVWQIPAPQR
jgi:hypothetical protein